MRNTKVKYRETEVLDIFLEQHRLCCQFDPESNPDAVITADMSVQEWRWASDLLPWKKLCQFLNQEFKINISEEDWYEVFEPQDVKKLKGICALIADNAEREVVEPITVLGRPCLEAAMFLTFRKNLKSKGVDVSGLKPSSKLGPYMDKYFSQVLEEVTLTGTRPIEKIETRRKKKKGFWNAINILDPDRYETLAGDIVTFRDLTEKILEQSLNSGHSTTLNQ